MNRHLTKNILPSEPEITILKSDNATLYDSNNKDYIDFSSQTLNLNLGNNNTRLIRAASKQMHRFTFLSSRFTNKKLLDLADILVKLAPEGLTKVNLKLTDGSDANESAFKRVRKYHGKQIIASLYYSHHGETSETINASGKHFENRKYIGGSQNFVFFNPPHPDFIPSCRTINEAELASLNELESLINKEPICAVIVEPIMVNAGVYILSAAYLEGLRKLCTENNISLIFDEIQTSFGWLDSLFYANKVNVQPDLLTTGKALASGFPLAAVLMVPEYDVLDYSEDEFTYGGHAVSCAVALEGLKILQSEKMKNKWNKSSKVLKKHLTNLKKDCPFIRDVRGEGLIWSIDIDQKLSPQSTSTIYARALKEGLILRKSQDGLGSSLVIKPSLTIPPKLIDEGFRRLNIALKM